MMNKNNITQTVYNALFNRINRRLLITLATIICLLSVVGTVYLMMQELPAVSVVVRRVDVNGKIQTSVRQMNAENVTINSNGAITGGLYIPGTPNVRLNGRPIFGGVVQGTGNPQPTNHQVTLNSNATLGKLFNRIDPVPLPTVAEPPATSGTRDVNINNANDQIGDFATIRDLTINGNVPPVVVPAGTYRNFTANNGGFILGVSGATQASVYNFNKLTLNGNTQLQVLGPVIVTLKETFTFNGSVGNSTNSNLLTLKVSNGSVTLNGNASLSATVIAPTGTVTVNGNCTLKGVVIADKLTVNGNGIVNAPTTAINAPSLTIQQPANNTITQNNTVTVTGTVVSDFAPIVKINGAEAVLNGNSFSADVALAEGSNTINITAIDFFSNQTTATVVVVKDTTPPALTISQPNEGAFVNTQQVLVTGTVSDSTTTQVTVNDVIATISNGQYTATVPINNEGINTLTVRATDFVNNQTTLTRNIIRDTTPPLLTVTQPQEGDTFTSDEIIVTGSFMDTNSVIVMVNGVAATISANDFTAIVPLNNGANTITIIATDIAGNQSQVIRNVIRSSPNTLTLTVFDPIDGSITNASPLLVNGIVKGSGVTVKINDIFVPVTTNGIFNSFTTVNEGNNVIHITASDSSGNQVDTTRNVFVDIVPPVISEISPISGTTVNSNDITVTGRAIDPRLVKVTVNGINAVINADGFFTAVNVPISEGENYIPIIAMDTAGNRGLATLFVVNKDKTPPEKPNIFPVISPTRLNYQSLEGRAEAGSLINIIGGVNPISVNTSLETGLFLANIDLVSGINNLFITATDSSGNTSVPAEISIISDPGLPIPGSNQAYQINISTGDTQRGLINTELPRPLIASITDKDGNPVSGISVNFSITQGGKFTDNTTILTAITDVNGQATARYICGLDEGIQLIKADFGGNTLSTITFIAQALEPSNSITSVSGVVVDQNLRALPNVLVRIAGQQTRTNTTGDFIISNVSAGPNQLLELIGRDQITLPGRWPNISYDIDILPGINNNLGRPLFLPRVNEGVNLPLDANSIVVQDTLVEQSVIGQLPIKIKARAGTRVIFPPDVTDKRLSVTRIAADRIPMELEEGRTTNLYISVQPGGAIFDPPLEVTFPNFDLLAPNAQVLLMSFDHDAGRYVQVGTGHVSSDGKLVTSDPGNGIRVGAWHAIPPPPPAPTTTLTGSTEDCMCMVWSGGRQAISEGSVPVGLSSPTANNLRQDELIEPLANNTRLAKSYRVNVPSSNRQGSMQSLCEPCALKFIRQDNTPIPIGQDPDACHMISKLRPDEGFPLDAIDRFNATGTDPDTFRVELTDLKPGLQPKIKLEIGANYSRSFNMVEGMVDGKTVYRMSEWVRLVSNGPPGGIPNAESFYDDEYPVIASELTALAKLGDKVKATLILSNGAGQSIELNVGRPPSEDGPKAIRTIEVKFNTLTGVNSDSIAAIERLNTYWAQACIRFNSVSTSAQPIEPVSNVFVVGGVAADVGQIDIEFVTNNASNMPTLVELSLPVAKQETLISVSDRLVQEISKKGIPVEKYIHNDSTDPQGVKFIILVNRGKQVSVLSQSINVNGLFFDIPQFIYDEFIDNLAQHTLGLNYGRNTASDDKNVYLVGVGNDVQLLEDTALGRAAGYYIKDSMPGFVNFVVLNERVILKEKNASNPTIIGHELCHVLLNGGNPIHSQETTNLAYGTHPVTVSTDGPKRLTVEQNTVVRSKDNEASQLLQKK